MISSAALMEIVRRMLPMAHTIDDIDLLTEPGAVRFRWAACDFRVDCYGGWQVIGGSPDPELMGQLRQRLGTELTRAKRPSAGVRG